MHSKECYQIYILLFHYGACVAWVQTEHPVQLLSSPESSFQTKPLESH